MKAKAHRRIRAQGQLVPAGIRRRIASLRDIVSTHRDEWIRAEVIDAPDGTPSFCTGAQMSDQSTSSISAS
jgi:hypothetical protein